MEKLTKLNTDNIAEEHICCAISDKKCKESYGLKKDWLKKEFDNGYVFRRTDARNQGKSGLVTVVGTKKFHFMSDTKWFLKQGFIDCQRISSGFSLLVMKIDPDADTPKFKESVISGECFDKKGICPTRLLNLKQWNSHNQRQVLRLFSVYSLMGSLLQQI